MKTMKRIAAMAASAALVLAWAPALAQAPRSTAVIGEKLDSGLGELPPYASWDDKYGRVPVQHRVAGESIDDGLGELPHYSHWLDRSGRDPMGRGTLNAGLLQR